LPRASLIVVRSGFARRERCCLCGSPACYCLGMIGWVLISAAVILGVVGWLVWRRAVQRELAAASDVGVQSGMGRQVGLVMGVDSVLTGVAGVILAFY
jgi:hypothetical protein